MKTNKNKKIIINRNSTDTWKEDTRLSVEFYNDWFLKFAPSTYVRERKWAMKSVGEVIRQTDYFHFNVEQLKKSPKTITTLRMATTPPIAKARLVGFSGVKPSFLDNLENGKIPAKMGDDEVEANLAKLIIVLEKLLDREIFPWLKEKVKPSKEALKIAECIVADRLCGTLSDPIIRNEQEKRQLKSIEHFLSAQKYTYVDSKNIHSINEMQYGTYCFHLNVPVTNGRLSVNMPIDVVVKRKNDDFGSFPLLIECKSAGDYANPNKRRKEEAQKMLQLKATYGEKINFVLFLCGYFDSGYLGYEAAEGIDWIWEHRIDDLLKAGI